MFRLATYVEPDPLIFPVTVANFDKRLARTTLTAVIHEPFRLGDHLEEPGGDDPLFKWLAGFQETFRRYVAEAVELAGLSQPTI